MKKNIKFQLYDLRGSIFTYYAIVAAVIFMLFILISTSGRVNGLEFAAAIFLLILGSNGHRESFQMLMQNGQLRSVIWKSKVAALLVICAAMSLTDKIIVLLANAVGGDKRIIESLFDNHLRFFEKNELLAFGLNFIVCFLLYMAVSSIGYFIAIANDRLYKQGRILFSFILYGGSIVLVIAANAAVKRYMSKESYIVLMKLLSGGCKESIFFYIGLFLFVGICFLAISRILIRKAALRD